MALKRYVVIGLGHFGTTVAKSLYEAGHDVVAIDRDEAAVDALGPKISFALVGDATQKNVLADAGVKDADAVIISTGQDFAASTLALLAVRDLGVQNVYVKVLSEEHARIAGALGASEAIFPEKEAAQNLAARVISTKLLEYVKLSEELALQEMAVPKPWEGKTLKELKLPDEHGVYVVAVHDMLKDVLGVPRAEQKLTPSDTILVAGAPKVLARLAKLK